MTAYENILTAGILFGLAVLGYAKMKDKSLTDIFNEIKEMFVDKTEDLDLKW